MTIETCHLLGGLLCGAALGIGAGVAVTKRAVLRRFERATPVFFVRVARLCLMDLRGTDQASVLAVYRAQAAVFNLAVHIADARKFRKPKFVRCVESSVRQERGGAM
jgi:hypothetical protein